MHSLKQMYCSWDTYCRRTYTSLPSSRRQDFIDRWYEKQETLRNSQRVHKQADVSTMARARDFQRDREDDREEDERDLGGFKVDWGRVEKAQKKAQRDREALEIEAEIAAMHRESNKIVSDLRKGRAAVAKDAIHSHADTPVTKPLVTQNEVSLADMNPGVESAVTLIPFSHKSELVAPTTLPHALLSSNPNPSASLIQEETFSPSPFLTQNLIISLLFWSVVTAAFVSFYLSLVRRRRKLQSRSRCASEYGQSNSSMGESNYYARREREAGGWLSRGGSPVTEPLPVYLIDDGKVVDLGREYEEEERGWHARESSLPEYRGDDRV